MQITILIKNVMNNTNVLQKNLILTTINVYTARIK